MIYREITLLKLLQLKTSIRLRHYHIYSDSVYKQSVKLSYPFINRSIINLYPLKTEYFPSTIKIHNCTRSSNFSHSTTSGANACIWSKLAIKYLPTCQDVIISYNQQNEILNFHPNNSIAFYFRLMTMNRNLLS